MSDTPEPEGHASDLLTRARASALVYRLTDDASPLARVRIAVRGDDRAKWLNGMLTCDLAAFAKPGAPRLATYGCALNVKGRMLADVVVVVDGESLSAWVPRSTAPALLELWNRYIIMEDCEIELDSSRALIALQGDEAVAVAARSGVEGRSAVLDELGLGAGLVFEIDASEVDAFIAKLVAAGAKEQAASEVAALRIRVGRATYGLDVDDHAYVQEAGLEKRAVSFNKGCYLGQEVVCMLEMRGKVHRRLVQLAASTPLAVGAEVRVGADAVGKITSIAANVGSDVVALAMVKTSAAELGKSLDVDGHVVTVRGEAR